MVDKGFRELLKQQSANLSQNEQLADTCTRNPVQMNDL